ncbi:MAG TPA: hypothetical protein VLW86_01905, partial [Syntrophorhabdales bacterium]|nr:hypothetical protein [Syntrophorhabdales bacterium]
MKRLFVLILTISAVALMGSASPRPLWAEADDAPEAGIDAYVYAYPLVLMDMTHLYVEKANGAKDNTFFPGEV